MTQNITSIWHVEENARNRQQICVIPLKFAVSSDKDDAYVRY